MTDATGFATLPWDLYTANNGDLDGLPEASRGVNGSCCKSEWVGPTDEPGESPWLCCLPEGHPGSHRAQDSVSVVAEWRTEDTAEVVR